MSVPTEDSGQQKSPEELREEINETRQDLGDTVEALAEKADVKAQAKDRISAATHSAQQKQDEFVAKAQDATPDSASAGLQQVASAVQRKPVPFTAAGAFLAGVLLGRRLGRR
jgi:ElaB/YqjD/DUF883 family membrane-anchored ribosome-binding protein